MDGHQFDDLLRALSESRRSLLGAALAAAGGLVGFTTIDAKKRKKKCAKKCKDGCCTGKFGKCIKPTQQNASQCGSGGEICRSTGCGGGGDTCATTCEGCCAGNECIEVPTDDQCGNNGSACVPCVGEEICAGECCIPPLKSCSPGGTRCCSLNQCESGKCCVPNNGSCDQDSDCCDAEDVCDGGQCGRPLGATCVPGDIMCIRTLECHVTTLTCGPRDCTNPCAELGWCNQQPCFGTDLFCCPADITDDCNVPEFFCECITEGGGCYRV